MALQVSGMFSSEFIFERGLADNPWQPGYSHLSSEDSLRYRYGEESIIVGRKYVLGSKGNTLSTHREPS